MRKSLIQVLTGLVLVFFAADASAIELSVGGFGGLNYPVVMEDVSSGKIYGLKARLAFMPYIGLEPNLTFSDYGDAEAEVYDEIQTRDGGKITSFGIDAVLGGIAGNPGLSVFGILGIGSSSWSREGLDDLKEMSYYLGFGLEYSLNIPISIEFKAKAQIIPFEDGSYKNGLITAGINYYFGEVGGK